MTCYFADVDDARNFFRKALAWTHRTFEGAWLPLHATGNGMKRVSKKGIFEEVVKPS